MADPNPRYDKKQLALLKALTKKIQKIYESSIVQISMTSSIVNISNVPFSLNAYPALKKKIEQQMKGMHTSIISTIISANKDAWDLANKKNDLIVDKRLASKKPSVLAKQILYDPNLKALSAFNARKEKGLNLSKRVWNTLAPFKNEMEQAVGLSIAQGKSAIRMAGKLKQYLQDPDKLFRRVRSEEGELKLSKAARNYSPGQGVYRSSFKNARRLAGTENNMAYRLADFERWQKLPFVIGIEIHLSQNHPRYDICDTLVGRYPKDFYFPGWHPQCICYATPIMMSSDEYNTFEDRILAGENITDLIGKGAGQITEPPTGFFRYVRENKKRIAGWRNTPYWVRQNREYYDQAAASRRRSTASEKLKPAGQAIAAQFSKIEKGIRTKVQTALNLIDQVHGDGTLKDIPFQQVSRKGWNAAFEHNFNGDPTRIMLSSQATGPELSLIHEMGHYFDIYAIGQKGVFDSQISGSTVSKVVEAARETQAIKDIQTLFDAGTGAGIPFSVNLKEHLRYLLSDHEIFARTYAQYVATVTSNAKLLAGVAERLASKERTGISYQWEKEDFEPLMDSMDEMMQELGWRV